MKHNKFLNILFTFLLLSLLLSDCSRNNTNLSTPEWSQWRGPNRDGISTETGLLKQWPPEGPKLLWSIEGIGAGFSSIAVSNHTIYTTGKKDSLDYLTAIDRKGKMKWQMAYGLACRQSFPESRCTPTVEGDRIYLISGRGDVVYVDAENGKKIWSVAAFDKLEGQHGRWEIAESPLVVDDKVIYTPGGDKTTIVALDKTTGETVWMSESLHDFTAYVAPLLIEFGGKKIIVNVTGNYLFGVDVVNGTMLWKIKYSDIETPTWHPDAPVINANTPLFHDGQIYVTSGYNHVGAMFKLSEDGSEISFVWSDSTLDTHIGGVVLVDGYIYGSNWLSNEKGNWCCIDWNTGAPMYEQEWQNKGSIIYADGMLYCYEERRGNVALLRATPDDFEIVSSFKITQGSGPHWAHPAINNGILYIRHGDVLMAYDIKAL